MTWFRTQQVVSGFMKSDKLALGIIFYQNEDGDVLDIQADIIGPVETPYYGGIFRCKLVLETGFPANPPKGFFLTKIFHPNVATPSGDICVNTLKKDWNPAKWSLKHIFEVIKCLLIVPFPESSLNEEAGRQFMEDYDSFCNHAKVYTEVHARPNAVQRTLIEDRISKEA
jgi:ubiquitin-conjugating enzyme E2 S